MNFIPQFTKDQWIAIAAIAVPLLIGLVVYIFRQFTKEKKSAFFDELDCRFTQLNPQIWSNSFLDKKGKTSVKRIIKVHGVVFQNEPFKSGELRNHDVEIISYTENSSANNIQAGTKDTKLKNDEKKEVTKVYGKSEVEAALKRTVKMWNKWAIKKNQLDHKAKIDLASRFHTYFEIIHPFLDGNGRIGRMLMNEQLSFLFGEIIDFTPDTKDYYEAVKLASQGDESKLKKVIANQVSKGKK